VLIGRMKLCLLFLNRIAPELASRRVQVRTG
jgi:hypothetical protein